MSTEKLISNEDHNLTSLETPKDSDRKFTGRVDINDLLARARQEKVKENKVTLVFSCLIAFLVLIVGILLSF
jgi:hypothetical protein